MNTAGGLIGFAVGLIAAASVSIVAAQSKDNQTTSSGTQSNTGLNEVTPTSNSGPCTPPAQPRGKKNSRHRCPSSAPMTSTTIVVNCTSASSQSNSGIAPEGSSPRSATPNQVIVNCQNVSTQPNDGAGNAELRRIASSIDGVSKELEKLSNKPDHTFAVMFFSLVVAFIGAALSYWFANQLRRNQTEETRQELTKKRAWIFKLMHDEITLRWAPMIGSDLMTISKMTDRIAAAKEFVGTMEIAPEDLIVFKTVATSPSDYYFIEDPALMSKIIYVHVLMRDLLDLRKSTMDIYVNTQSDEPGADFLQKFRTIVEALDSVLDEIRGLIEQKPSQTLAA